MSSISQIALDLAQLAQNIARLQEQASAIPERAQVAQVLGAEQEQAQQEFYKQLKQVAARVARKTETVRLYVEQNADALQKAADALQNTDGDHTLATKRASEFIGHYVDQPSKPTTTVQPTTSAPGSSPTSAPGSNPLAW